MMYADIADEINAKVKEQCKLMTDEPLLKARVVKPITPIGYLRPELSKRKRTPSLIACALAKSRDAIRSVFGVPAGGM